MRASFGTFLLLAALSLLTACSGAAGAPTSTTAPPSLAVSASPTAATPSPSPAAQTAVTLSGAVQGALSDLVPQCDHAENVGGQPPHRYDRVDGKLGDRWFELWVFDPTGSGEYESGSYVLATELDQDPASPATRLPLSHWQSPYGWMAGISGFGIRTGASVSAVLAPRTDIQGRGTAQSPDPLRVNAVIVCV